jgi:hypothetical protein
MATISSPYNADLDTLTLYKHETVTIVVPIVNEEGAAVDMVALDPDQVEFQVKALPGTGTALLDKYLTSGVTLTTTGIEIAIATGDLSAFVQATYWGDLAIKVGSARYYAACPFPVHVREVVTTTLTE